MPRIYTSQSDPVDFCLRHFPTEEEAEVRYGQLGDGPDDRGNCFEWAADHPPYDEAGQYQCEVCNRPLTEDDD